MNRRSSASGISAIAAVVFIAGCGSGSSDRTVAVNGDVPLA